MQIDPQNGELTWVPDETQGPATYDVIVFATDDGTPPAIGTRTIQIQVNEVNRPPVLAALVNQQVFQGHKLAVQAAADDPDEPLNALSYSLEAGSPLGAQIDPATGVISWTPGMTQTPGDYSFAVRVTDSGAPALMSVKSFTVTVGAINHAPSFASTGNIAVADEGGPQSFASYVSAVSAGPPEDVGQAVQLVVTVTGGALFLVPPSLDATGKLTFTPAPNAHGTAQISIQARDDGGTLNGGVDASAVQTFSILVNKPYPWHNTAQRP